MAKTLKEKVLGFFEKQSNNPLFLGFVCGVYPLLSYASNNFYAVNSLQHFFFFCLLFIGISIVLFLIAHLVFKKVNSVAKYREHILFIMLVFITSVFMSLSIFLLFKKKILLVVLVLSALLSIKLYKSYKKITVLIFIMASLSFFSFATKFYYSLGSITWLEQPDKIEDAIFKKTPNVYMIQPDGYVSQSLMEDNVYNHKSDLYSWLQTKDFKLYPNFRSNYPASLSSNASLFAMRHHFYGETLFPSIEMPKAREVICGENPVISVFKKNDYKTHFIVQDEYFQQNYANQNYDYTNIALKDISYLTDGNKVKRKVFDDLKIAMAIEAEQSKFFFIEKLLPHHVSFNPQQNKIEKDRQKYISRIEEVNDWLKETINFITKKDANAIIIVLADHGGWLGLENYKQMFTTQERGEIASIFSSIAAIKWNGNNKGNYDANLKTNVNVFRVLFSALSENKSYLNHLEEDSSYNLHVENQFYNSVYKVIDDNGEIVYKKHSR